MNNALWKIVNSVDRASRAKRIVVVRGKKKPQKPPKKVKIIRDLNE